MSADWVPIRLDLFDDVNVLALAARLGVSDVDAVVGKLVRFWTWASRNSTDGELPGMTPEALDGLLRCPGFAVGLSAVKPEPWLVISKQGLRIPRWDRWLSDSAKSRAGETLRKRLQRRRDEGESLSGAPPDTPQRPNKKCPDKLPDKAGTKPGQKRDHTATETEKQKAAAAPPRSPVPKLAAAGGGTETPHAAAARKAGNREEKPPEPRAVGTSNAVWEVLKSGGIDEPVRSELAASGLDADAVRAAIVAHRKKPNKGTGVLVITLRGMATDAGRAAERKRRVYAELEAYHALDAEKRGQVRRWFREHMQAKGRDFWRVPDATIEGIATFADYLLDELKLTDGSMEEHAQAASL